MDRPMRDTSLKAAALALPPSARRELAQELLWSLSREDVLAISARIRLSLQKDIIGDLPPEISCQILAHLDLDDIFKCNLVSKRWAALCNEQRLWSLLCLTSSPPIRPRDTTREELLARQRVLDKRDREKGRNPLCDDEDLGWNPDIADYPQDLYRPQVIPGMDLFGDVRGFRGTVWERSGSGPSTHMHASPARSSASRSRHSRGGSLTDTEPEQTPKSARSLASSLDDEEVIAEHPRVNYKHLYLVNRTLRRRLRREDTPVRQENPLAGEPSRHDQVLTRPRVYDAVSSVEAGGLAGHDCAIYTLQLIHRRMTVELPHMCSESSCNHAKGISQSSAGLPYGRTVTSRDWLLTGSRDQTMRLWDMSGPQPMVVKIFHGGHTGTILSLHVIELPQKDSAQKGCPANGATRLVVVSGGADGRVCLWDVEHGDGRPEAVSIDHTNSVLCVKADQHRVVSCSRDKTIRVFDIDTLEQRLVITDAVDTGDALSRSVINAFALSEEYIISVSGDKTVRVWDINTGEMLAGLQASYRGITSVDHQPAGATPHVDAGGGRAKSLGSRSGTVHKGTIVIGSADATISILRLVSLDHNPAGVHIVDALDMAPPPPRDVTFSEMMVVDADVNDQLAISRRLEPSGANVATPSLDNEECAGEDSPSTESELRIELQQVCWATCICPPAALASRGISSGIADVGNGGPSVSCWRCHAHSDLVRSLQIKEDVILSGGYDSTVKVWDKTTGKMLADLPASQSGRVFAAAGDKLRIVAAGLTARLTVWDLSGGLDTSFVEP